MMKITYLMSTNIPKIANLPLMPVVTSDNQYIPNVDFNLISPSLTLEVRTQIPSSNVKALQNTVKIKVYTM